MILQALTQYYSILAQKGKVPEAGWCRARVSFALSLSKEGEVKPIDLRIAQQRETKSASQKSKAPKTVMVPQTLTVPEMVSRSVNVSANFLCDNSKYILGIDKAGADKRALQCFEAAKERHLAVLENAHSDMAEAVKNFFMKWDPGKASEHADIKERWDELTAGGNIVFVFRGAYVHEDPEIREAWEKAYQESIAAESPLKEDAQKSVDDRTGICLVTGDKTQISRIHTHIKGVPGAQSSGATLVSFNSDAFESFGKEQNYNAPVGNYAAFAYTTTLNYLLADSKYSTLLGDTKIVFWAKSGEKSYQDAFTWSVEPTADNETTVSDIFSKLKRNEKIDIDGIYLDPNQTFYILGLAPNAARLSVRFFYRDSFGNILRNLSRHYDRMEIVKPEWAQRKYLSIGRMLWETVNKKSKDKKPIPDMAAMVFRAIMSDSRYPMSLYYNLLIRIRAEQGEGKAGATDRAGATNKAGKTGKADKTIKTNKVTWERAAIIKAILIKNYGRAKGELCMGLNEMNNEPAYVLGRIFSVLEEIQENTNPGINATIRDRYFNSACATPASIFPTLLKLKNSHLKKLGRQKEGTKIYYEKKLTDLSGRLDGFPRRLNLEEQGLFILGYYHQTQKRYEKKEEK